MPQIQNHKAKIGIIGLGYVGLPLAVEFADAGFSVTGFDVDPKKTKAINTGRSYILDIPQSRLAAAAKSKHLNATTDFGNLSKMDVIIICVPTPLRKTKDPDMSYIVAAVEKVRATLRKGQLIILESTTYPGTTRELVKQALEEKGFKVGSDFHLAFSPERVDPGNKSFGVKNTPKVVGGVTPRCTELAAALYGAIVSRVIPVSSPEAAEMIKLLENTFRAVNIGLVNEVALMCDRLGLDVWEIIDAAATKPFGFMPFYPGPGLGGHCIPLDPLYLSWKLKSLNFYSRFIDLASEINSNMPEHLVRKISESLNKFGKSIKGSKILVVGVAYKKDVNDTRESPALDVIELLEKRGGHVAYHDPFVPTLQVGPATFKSMALRPAILKKQDCVVITTNHSQLDVALLTQHSKLIVDSRNATKGVKSPKIVKL